MRWLVPIALVACHRAAAPARQDAAARPPDATAVAILAPPVDARPPTAAPTPVELAVGGHASCAVMSDSTVRCWGDNPDGELGNGTVTAASAPVAPRLRGVRQLALGDADACALLDDGSVSCWGKIGFGAHDHELVPTAVPGVTDAIALFVVGGAACATDKRGAVVCWGDVDAAG
ncbi:MAG TPA: hypothetical protein VLX92_32095, partial [Kofleriaceae bacterium]|nr:hypothetical protein [Kofleriaceae bacterium]